MFAVTKGLAALLACLLCWHPAAFAQTNAGNTPIDRQRLAATAPVPLLEQWLSQGPFRQQYLEPERYHLQILLTDIRRNSQGVSLTHHQYRPDAEYFYPASTVKLPVAVLALEYLTKARIPADSAMFTGVAWPGDTPRPAQPMMVGQSVFVDGQPKDSVVTKAVIAPPSVAEDVRRILLLSDNDAYNRLYELLGPAYINKRLQELQLGPVQIRHRLERFLTIEQNHQLPPVKIVNRHGHPEYTVPARRDALTPLRPATPIGSAHWRDNQRIASPLDFASRNQWTLQSMHRLTLMLSAAMSTSGSAPLQLSATDQRLLDYYRQITPAQLVAADRHWQNGQDDMSLAQHHRNQLSQPDRSWLQNALAEGPATVKFLYYGATGELDSSIVIRNKVGDAYGFYLDTAWFCDTVSGREFVLSALIYANSDGELGDSRYDDKTLALPYLRWLGRTAVAHARHQASLSPSSAEALAHCRNAASLITNRPM